MSPLRQQTLAWLSVAFAATSFLFGFLAHRARLHDYYVRPAVAYALGRSGGCRLAETFRAAHQIQALDDALGVAERDSKVVEEADNGYSRWETPLGSFWCPDGKGPVAVVARQLAKVYNPGDHSIQAGDVVLDCGAFIGDFVRVSLISGAKKVVAIEPSPVNVEALNRNFRQEIAEGRVVLIAKGVWHEDSRLKLKLHRDSAQDSFVVDAPDRQSTLKPREVEVPLTTIDKIVDELKLDAVSFIKVNAGGAERNAIRGAQRTISRFHPRLSVSTEGFDDHIVIPRVVAEVAPGYSAECGLCVATGMFEYKPFVYYFTPR